MVRRVIHLLGDPLEMRSGALRRWGQLENVPWKQLRAVWGSAEVEAQPSGQGEGRREGVRSCVCVCVQVYWYQEVFIDILKLIGLQQNLATFKI